MFLRQLFRPLCKTIICEGGNLVIGNVEANRIDSTKRATVVPIIDQALTAINNAYAKAHGNVGLWNPKLLASKKFLAGSSFYFFDRTGISDEIFAQVKRTVGDIDTMVDVAKNDDVRSWLANVPPGTPFGPARYVGMDDKDPMQVLTLWQFPDIVIVNNDGKEFPINVQIDLEMKGYENDEPTEWDRFSTSSSWEDLSVGIKGVFHKFLIQSLASLTKKEFLLRKAVGRGKARALQDVPTTDNMYSFAIKSKEGGGLRAKYDPVIDPATGEQEYKDGLPIYTARDTTGYEKDITKIFQAILSDRVNPKDLIKIKEKFWSFVGILDVLKTYLGPEEQSAVANSFIDKLFAKGAQGLYADNKEQDRDEKTAAVNKMFEILEMEPPADFEQKVTDYYTAYKVRVNEEEEPAVTASPRKGVVHLEKMKDIDFLDLLDELKDEGGNTFRLNNIAMTVKIDGMGGRFGKDRNGRPFFESSSSGPIFEPGAFTTFAQNRGITDPVQLERAQKYDDLYNEVMEVITLIDKQLGPKFLQDVKVHCEVLYAPMATEDEGGLKFVSVVYDKLPEGVNLALVPLFIEIASTGNTHPKNDAIKQKLVDLDQLGASMFIDNKLVHEGDLDVTGIIAPLENVEELRGMLTSGKRALKAEASTAIEPIKNALAKAIINNPGIVGKDKLGSTYEGIILYTNKGPVKITSPEFKDIMAQKMAARSAPQQTQRPSEGKSAVVTGGSFVGHKGHQLLIDTVFSVADAQDRTPFVYISSVVGPDDPIPAEYKLKTWQMLYPEKADAFQLVQEGGNIMKKIEKEIIFSQGYKNILVIVGSDRAAGFDSWLDRLRKRLANPQYPENQDVVINVKPRQEFSASSPEGVRFTDLRNILKDPNKTPEEQLDLWCQGFDESKLGRDWIRTLMEVSRKNMGLSKKTVKESVMSGIHLEVGDKLDKAIALYKKQRLDAEVLGDFCVKLANNVSKKLNLDKDAVQDVINDYVDKELGGIDEECAGVGIVTKQNSTADVGPGTLGKMLRSLKLA